MTTKVYCKTTQKGLHSFYLFTEGDEYFLFSQKYRKGVQNYFGKGGVYLDQARNFAKSNRDTAIVKTMNKLPVYIRYIEKEYDIAVLNQTKKRNRTRDFTHIKEEYCA